jgi:hypothetical protein
MNTDSFWLPGADRPIARLIEAFGAGDADAVLLCVPPDRASGYFKGPDFLLSGDGTISKTLGRPVVYAGVALIARHLAAQGPDVPFSLYRHFEAAREAGRLKGVEIVNHRYHVGDHDAIIRNIGASFMEGLRRPTEVNQLFVDHMMLALTAHVAQTYGGLKRNTEPGRGGLAPWQARRAWMRRRNTSRSTTTAVPASTSAIRRASSRSQASAASMSAGASRLATNEYAKSARSASLRLSASARSF